MNKTLRAWLDAVLFIIIYIVMQMAMVALTSLVANLIMRNQGIASTPETTALISAIGIALASVLTISIFVWRRWSPFSRAYLRSRPWVVLLWIIALSIGTILPSEWLIEEMQVHLPFMDINEAQLDSVMALMQSPLGYLVVGILAPICEEMVFRGAVLRSLLTVFKQKNHWWAIAASALLFGVMHLNFLQGIHAFIIGLLLGWMYYRTNSIVPGIVFHWVNNTVAFVMIKIMPQMADGKLIDLFHGDDRLLYSGLLCSLCILVPSLLQVAQRMKRPE